MATVRVRRSGIVAFAVRTASAITGLVFVVLVTNNISQSDFGLWSLILRVVGYVSFAGTIISFWTVRYRARGSKVGKTSFIGALILSAVLSGIYLPVALVVAETATPNFGYSIFYFLLISPQIFLSISTGAIESVLLGYFPEKASAGFLIYEFAKIIIGFVMVPLLKLSLEGAILAVIVAQICQIISLLVVSKNEFSGPISFAILGKMFRTGWLAVFTSISPIIVSFDFLIVSEITKSLDELGFYGAALTIASVVGYSSWITTGLYSSILSGKESKSSTSQIFDLQLMFIVPMTLGAIILSYRMLYAFKAVYAPAWPILVVLALAAALAAITNTPETVISGTDLTDVSTKADFSLYSKSRLFLLSRINIGLALGHLIGLAAISFFFSATLMSSSVNFLGYKISGLIVYGVVWGFVYLFVSAAGFGIKMRLSLRFLPFKVVDRRALLHVAISALCFSISLLILSSLVPIRGGVFEQVISITAIGLAALGVYSAVLLALDSNIRTLTKAAVTMLVRS